MHAWLIRIHLKTFKTFSFFFLNVFKKNLMNQNQNHSHFFLQLIANRNSLYQC